jgi:histidinol dehydrogenase
MKTIEYGNIAELEKIIDRSGTDPMQVLDIVRPIVEDVRSRGDAALIDYTKKFDNYTLTDSNIRVKDSEIKAAQKRVDNSFAKALKHAKKNIAKYHQEQLKNIKKSWKTETDEGVEITERTRPIRSCGAYIPGGRASYPSTVLMTCAVARIAGVERIVVMSPPPITDEVLYACDLCGVDEVYRVGGAQAIAALAYGTGSIEKVDKIVGPGNKYVTCAKLLVYGKVDIDMPAGPSEVLIIADGKADPSFIAADLLAQAEHDPDARSILVTDSKELSGKVSRQIQEQRASLKRTEIIAKSLEHSYAILVKDMDEAALFADRYAPEHLEINAADAQKISEKITNAGTIFIGGYAPVAAGDYASGENHVLPTGGSAKFSSALGVRDFLRSYSVQEISEKGLRNLAGTIETLAEAESLDAHSRAVKRRF